MLLADPLLRALRASTPRTDAAEESEAKTTALRRTREVEGVSILRKTRRRGEVGRRRRRMKKSEEWDERKQED